MKQTMTCDLEKGDVVQYGAWPIATVVRATPLGSTRYSTWRVELHFPCGFKQPFFCFGPTETFNRPFGD